MRILLTGGNGYIGSKLVPLLKNHEVTVLDIAPPRINLPENCRFILGDICDELTLLSAIRDSDTIISLAGIVGFPACDADPANAWKVNVETTKFISRHLEHRLHIYASTQSVYGAVETICNEETPTNPTSLYGRTKARSEELLGSTNSVILRFGTGFGVSPKMRDDLLINNFVKSSVDNGFLELFEPNFNRSFIHVSDMGRAIVFAINNANRMMIGPFNVGDESLNLTKMEIAEAIAKRLKLDIRQGEGTDKEKRNYFVSYGKIHAIGFHLETTFEEGLEELIKVYE